MLKVRALGVLSNRSNFGVQDQGSLKVAAYDEKTVKNSLQKYLLFCQCILYKNRELLEQLYKTS